MEPGTFFSLFSLSFFNTMLPGPGVLLVAGTAAQNGVSIATRAVLGLLMGTVVLLGVAIASSFGVLSIGSGAMYYAQWVGVVVLGYLAWLVWPKAENEETHHASQAHSPFFAGMALSLTQPLHLVFLLAIISQFSMNRGPVVSAITGLGFAILFGEALAFCLVAFGGQAFAARLNTFRTGLCKVVSASFVVFAVLSLLSALDVGLIGGSQETTGE